MAATPVPPAARHGANALAALVILTVVGFVVIRTTVRGTPADPVTVTVAVEHAKPTSVTITLGRRGRNTLVDVSVRAEEAVILSVPDTWQLRETRGVALSHVTQMDPADGYRQIRMPTGTASFIAPQAIRAVEIHNPTSQPLRARVVSLDLVTQTQHEDEAIVMKDPVTLPASDTSFEQTK